MCFQDEKEYFNVIFVNLDGNSKQEANPMFFSKVGTVLSSTILQPFFPC